MSAPRRTRALAAADRALQRARERLAAGEPGWDPWRVAEAQARYDAALNEALAGGGRLEPIGEPVDDVPAMLTRAVRDGGQS